MKRIIFVDDEENVLQGLKRMLRSIRKDWDITLAESAEEALEIMDREPLFDLVISDIRMPGMDGIEFLSRVREQHPLTVRFGLSGQADSQALFKGANISHQFIRKPCHPQSLHNLIARALALRDHLSNDGLKKMLLEIGALPSLPALYQEILNEIQSPDPSVARIGEIIKQDVAMSAKVLQIVNSAFMGLRHQASNPAHAAALLGLENLRGIVLMIGVFTSAENKPMPRGFSLDALWHHSLRVAGYAKRIAENEVEDRRIIDDSFTAGLLHDVGQIILATKLPDEFAEALDRSKKQRVSLFDAEKEILDATHAEIGGFLLELWGLPDPIVEAITFHDYPCGGPEDDLTTSLGDGLPPASEQTFKALTAVHVANYFCEEAESADDGPAKVEIDTVYLDRVGSTDRVEAWWDLCRSSDP